MRFAYADPPYYGCAMRYYSDHPEAQVYDTLDGHRALIDRLELEFPDGWAVSMTSGNLFDLLPLFPKGCRVGAWIKPFASFKPNVNPAYAWEPIVFKGGRKRTRIDNTVRDWVSANITLKKGLTGAKPKAFNEWIIELLGFQPGDELIDIFPGTHGMSQYLEQRII